MNDERRIRLIKQARTNDALGKAIAGYQEQAVSAHPELQTNSAFNTSMQSGRFFHALGDIKRASRGKGDKYRDVICMLEFASKKELALMQ